MLCIIRGAGFLEYSRAYGARCRAPEESRERDEGLFSSRTPDEGLIDIDSGCEQSKVVKQQYLLDLEGQ
jgi:hypothetical protein